MEVDGAGCACSFSIVCELGTVDVSAREPLEDAKGKGDGTFAKPALRLRMGCVRVGWLDCVLGITGVGWD